MNTEQTHPPAPLTAPFSSPRALGRACSRAGVATVALSLPAGAVTLKVHDPCPEARERAIWETRAAARQLRVDIDAGEGAIGRCCAWLSADGHSAVLVMRNDGRWTLAVDDAPEGMGAPEIVALAKDLAHEIAQGLL